MRRKRILWQLYVPLMLVILPPLLGVTLYASQAMNEVYADFTRKNLEIQSRLLAADVAPLLVAEATSAIAAFTADAASVTGCRITVIRPDGLVLGESTRDVSSLENHAHRPEVKIALAGDTGSQVRYSTTWRGDMHYVAVPVLHDGALVGVMRVAMPLHEITAAMSALYRKVLLGGALAAAVTAVLCLVISRRITRPLEEMKHGAERFARGDLSSRLRINGSEEISSLAVTLNQMAGQLESRIHTILAQRNELEAVLSSMVEGVLAVDSDQRLLNMNRAAATLLGIEGARADGRTIHEVIRNSDLLEFVSDVLAADTPLEGDITLRNGDERYLQAHGSVLRNEEGREIGALVVLNDVTRLRRLENMRRDFVANVSHELRTPITSIKGFVETLQDGALDNRKVAEHFLDIVARQADRLNAIITDLLSLSRIEAVNEGDQISISVEPLGPVLQSAIKICEPKATDKGIEIELDCPPELTAPINAPLLEQALVNLIENGVKYSDPGSMVGVRARETPDEVIVSVQDHGCGIAKEHFPRLFERFYRVDKARSREQGGTGLGLAIVKHIAQSHGARISLESTLGQGSTFYIHLVRRSDREPAPGGESERSDCPQ